MKWWVALAVAGKFSTALRVFVFSKMSSSSPTQKNHVAKQTLTSVDANRNTNVLLDQQLVGLVCSEPIGICLLWLW